MAAARQRAGIFRAIEFVSSVCGVLSAGMVVAAVLITCQMIFVRYVLNQSTIWQTEAVIYLVIAATLMGLPYVQKLRGHVSVDLLSHMLPVGVRKWAVFVSLLLSMIMSAVVAFYGYQLWYDAWEWGEVSDTIWGVPLWIPYLPIPLGFGLYCLQLFADMAAPETAVPTHTAGE